MAQLSRPEEPFGEVNVHRRPDGSLQIVATVLMEPDIEGARAGLALDGSASMKKAYGANAALSPIFAKAAGVTNEVEPVARAMAGYLAKFSATGQVDLCYWAVGVDGTQVEPLGACTAEQAPRLSVRGPQRQPWGRGTKLLPPVRHFVEELYGGARWAICVFVTDGVIEDLEAVKQYSLAFAKQIAAGKRRFIKFVLLGVGEEVDEGQMEELDDMFENSPLRDPKGQPIDLWDHKLTSEMRHLGEVFAEVVSENSIVADHGQVLDDRGRAVKVYSDGLPALLRFTLPAGSRAFTLELAGDRITQDLTEVLDRR
jgi:hypothetical protein